MGSPAERQRRRCGSCHAALGSGACHFSRTDTNPYGDRPRSERAPHQERPLIHWRRIGDRRPLFAPGSKTETAGGQLDAPCLALQTSGASACFGPASECPARPRSIEKSSRAPADTGVSRPSPPWRRARELLGSQRSALQLRVADLPVLRDRRYAARFVSARRIHFAIAAGLAPMRSSDFTKRSRETDRSPASILATRDWLDPSRSATSVCVNPLRSRTSRIPDASASFNSMKLASSGLSCRKSVALPTAQPLR